MFNSVSSVAPLYSDLPRPFLKWAGGKGRLIEQYRSHFPRYFETYYEPFLGGGAIFFHLLPQRSLLTDINPELVNVYRCVRDQVDEVITLLRGHERSHSHDYYYQIRSMLYCNPIERAARLIYLNRTCYNGLYRENSKGSFNVPMGRYKNPTICNVSLLRVVSASLKATTLNVEPFDAVLENARNSRDFVYFDPPYHPISRTSNFTGYSRYSFHPNDQIRLRDTFVELARRGVKVMLSNSDCPFIRELYEGFHIHDISAVRAINSNAQKRGKISEVLVTSY
ncbi:MAG: DNA adenine methylase [Oculatellaceae cyanobacterium bins.114]|nr:DNA adenine methylase [Oculatellaceae cyanobacterium bins.114]